MATKTGIDTRPTDYQARLLLAALADSQHRIPSDAKGRTLDIMRLRQWIRPRRLTSTLAFVESGVKDYVLTHHGVNAANKVKAAQGSTAGKGLRTVDVEGIGWTCVEPGRKWAAEYEGVKFELERRIRNVRDECPDTGWYLYGGSHFGMYMAARFKEAAVAAFPYVCPKDGHPEGQEAPKAAASPVECTVCGDEGCADPTAPAGAYCALCGYDHASHRFRECATFATTVEAYEERHVGEVPAVVSYGPHLPEAALHLPAGDESGTRDVVVLQGKPDADGTVTAYSARQGKPVRIPLGDLHALPEVPDPAERGEETDWWLISDKDGREVARVQADGYETARTEAEKVPAALAASKRDGGLSYRRLQSKELTGEEQGQAPQDRVTA